MYTYVENEQKSNLCIEICVGTSFRDAQGPCSMKLVMNIKGDYK
jgi:hypothetical protein